jgi:outer membrane protein
LIAAAIALPSAAPRAQDVGAEFTGSYIDASATYPTTGLHGLLGAGVFNANKLRGEDERQTRFYPLVFLTYQDTAYFSFSGAGVWLLKSTDRSARVGLAAKLRLGYSAGDDTVLAGMERRDWSIEGGVNGVWRTPFVSIGGGIYSDLTGTSKGHSAALHLSRGFQVGQRWRLIPSAGLEWLSKDVVSYYYGVRAGEATPTRPAYDGRSSVNWRVGLTANHFITRNVALLAGVHYTHRGDGIVDSPIVSKSGITSFNVGGAWLF